MTALQKISQEAKRIYKANPNLSWKECIKRASLLYSKKKKDAIVKSVKSLPSKAKKVAVKKVKSGIKNLAKKVYDSKLLSGIKKPIAKKYAPVKPLIKKRIETKSDFAMAGIKKKKAVKKSPARSLHKDTKSHNVNIRVMSGINKHLVERISKINDEIEQRENVIFDVMSRKKDLISRHGEGWYKKWIKDAKGIITELKKHKTELKRFI